MKITDIEENLFTNLIKGDVIAHGANCQGVMGAGVAKEIKARFPANYIKYRAACNYGRFRPGDSLYALDRGISIYNLGTQYKIGPDAHIQNIISSVKSMLTHAHIRDQWVIKTVRLGSGIGGLDWNDVKPELEALDSPVELLVYYVPPSSLEGIK